MNLKKLYNQVLNFSLSSFIKNYLLSFSKMHSKTFLIGFFVAFISHLFIYTNRLYGNHDVGMIYRLNSVAQSGRWFNNFITTLNRGFVLPVFIGILNSFFLTLSSIYILKLFKIKSQIIAIIITCLMVTFPSIAFTNLFLYDAANYNFAVFLSVIAVYTTTYHKKGWIIGSLLIMLSLAIYQAKFAIVLSLIVFYLINEFISENFDLKSNFLKIKNFFLLVLIGSLLYIFSLPISFRLLDSDFGGQRGFSPDMVGERLESTTNIIRAFLQTYFYYFSHFFRAAYPTTILLTSIYILLAFFTLIVIIKKIIRLKIHQLRIRFIFLMILLFFIPLASNISGFLASDVYGMMTYAFVLTLVFVFSLLDRIEILPLIKSIFCLFGFIIVFEFITFNNTYYLQSLNNNVRLTSISTRIASDVESLMSKITNDEIRGFIIYDIPNEIIDLADSSQQTRFRSVPSISYAVNDHSFINIKPWARGHFRRQELLLNLTNLHGLPISIAPANLESSIRNYLLENDVPAWPAEGSILIVNDIIVVNFGTADLILNEQTQTIDVRITKTYREKFQEFRFNWQVFENDQLILEYITDEPNLSIEMFEEINNLKAFVTIINKSRNIVFPEISWSN